jgi:hypothetical protein
MSLGFSRRRLLAAVAVVGAQAVIFAPAHANVEAAASQAQPTATRQVSDTPNPNRQVCRQTRITGSRFQRSICRSASDRAAAEKEAQDTTRDFLAQDYVAPTDGGERPGPSPGGSPTPN